jgi:hypothetical protein
MLNRTAGTNFVSLTISKEIAQTLAFLFKRSSSQTSCRETSCNAEFTGMLSMPGIDFSELFTSPKGVNDKVC